MSKRWQRDIAPSKQQRELQAAQKEIDEALRNLREQLSAQSDSMFDGNGWSQAGLSGFGDALIAHGKQLVTLGELFNSGQLPRWVLDQQRAYESSAIGQLARGKQQEGANGD